MVMAAMPFASARTIGDVCGSRMRSVPPGQAGRILCAPSLAVSALAQTPPNLIFIMTDDQGIDAIDWPPHLIATAFTGSPPHRLRVLPMPSGTPIS